MRARTPALAASGAARSLPSRPPAQRPAGAGGSDPCGGSRSGSGGETPPPLPLSLLSPPCPRGPRVGGVGVVRLRRAEGPGQAGGGSVAGGVFSFLNG